MTVTTSDRVLGVMDLFGGDRAEWSVEDAAEALGLSVTTTYRYFKSLARSGLIHAYVPGRYVLGPAIIQFDRQMRLHDPLITIARPEMERLARLFGDQCVILLARLYHDRVMCVHQAFSERPPFAVSYERGRLMPIDRGAASKAILAYVTPRMLRALKQRRLDGNAPNVEMTAQLKSQLRDIRSRGFAITEAELDSGLRGIAVPIFQPDQSIDGSLSVVVPISATAGADDIVEQLILARKSIEAGLAIRASREGGAAAIGRAA